MNVVYLFDIDGTLLHARGSGRSAFDRVMREQHGVADASEGIRYGGKTDPAIVDEIFHTRLRRAPTPSERDAFFDAYIPRLHRMLDEQGVIVYDGVVSALVYLSTRARLAIATGNIRRGAEAKLAAAALERWFAFGGYGCDSAVRAELVAAAIARAGDCDEVVVVGDTIHDIAAARACNATVCAVATGADPASELAHADVVFTSLAELPAWHATRFG